MLRNFLTFLFLCAFTLVFSQSEIEEIEKLSKTPQNLEKAVEKLIEYIVIKEGLSEKEETLACSLYSKRFIFQKYGESYPELVNLIVKEDWEGLRRKLLVINEPLDEDFKLIFNIFPQFEEQIKVMILGAKNKDYEKLKEAIKQLKYIWKIPGYETFFREDTGILLYPVMLIALKDATFLDTDLRRFLIGIFSGSDFQTLEKFFIVQFDNLEETDYIAALKLSEFLIEGLNRTGKIPTNELVGLYAELSLYFSLERSLYSFAQNFGNIPDELFPKKLIELVNYLESWENLKVKRERLKNQMISMLSELTIRTQFIEKNTFSGAELGTLRNLVGNINTPEFVSKLSLILSTVSNDLSQESRNQKNKSRNYDFSSIYRVSTRILPFGLLVIIYLILPLKLKANLFGKFGFRKAALYFFKKMLRKNPSSPMLHAEIAAMYEKLGMIDQARIEYKIAMRLLENLENERRRKYRDESSNL